MRTTIFFLMLILFASTASYSQVVDNTVNKVDNTINQANKASETFGKLKGLFPKKKNKSQPVDSSSTKVVPKAMDSLKAATSDFNVTIVKITGIDYATLKKLYGNIQACEGVQEAKMKFGADLSSVEIKHKGATEELLNTILLTSKDIFTENNIAELEEGKVSLNLKK